MNLIEILTDKSLKGTERAVIISAIVNDSISLNEIMNVSHSLDEAYCYYT